jgi:predicted TIM-barrel fold metal-dependent hydrolase
LLSGSFRSGRAGSAFFRSAFFRANFLWDTDYPHPDGTFPWGIGALLKQPIPFSSKKKILWDNATRAFGFN